jgi:putative ABC transport system permease protein
LNSFRLLHLRRFLEHPGRTALSVAGIAIGAALVVAVLGFFGSLNGSVDAFTRDLAGAADLEVAAVSDDGFDEKLFFDIEKTEGVSSAIPMIRSPATVNGRRAVLIGLDQRARKLATGISSNEAGRLQAQTNEPGLFLGAPLAELAHVQAGGKVAVYSLGTQTAIKVLGVLTGESARFNQGMFAGAALPIAQRLGGKLGKLDSVLVIATKGADVDELRLALSKVVGPPAAVQSLSQRAEQARLATRNIQTSMLMGVGMALAVGAFLIFNTMNMAATERRRELATLRALGGRRRPLLFFFLIEAGLLGLIGSGIGSVLGLLVARRLVEGVPPFILSAVGVEIGFYLPTYVIPAALTAGVLASMLAAYLPARRAVRVPPVESMRPEGVLESVDAPEGISIRITAVGAAMVLGGSALSIWGSGTLSFIWVGTLLLGVMVASYGLTGPITKATSAVATRIGASGRLAAAAVERAPRRAWATSAAVVVATAMVVAQSGLQNNLTKSLRSVVGSLESVDLFVSASTGTAFAEVALPGDWADDIKEIPGVAEVGVNNFLFTTFRGQKILLQGLEGRGMATAAPAFAGATPEIIDRFEAGDGAVLSTRFSNLYDIKKGDKLKLPTPTGLKNLDVIHVAPAFTWERGMVSIANKRLAEWFRHTGVSDYGIELKPGAEAARVQADLQAFVATSPVPAYVFTGHDQLAAIFRGANQITQLFQSMTAVVVGAALLAIFNALLISVVERRRELGIMRALGTSRKQMRRMVALEAAGLGLVGGVAGALVGFLLHRTAISAIAEPSGFPLAYQFVPAPALAAIAIGIGIAALASLIPARRAGAVNIVEAIGYE